METLQVIFVICICIAYGTCHHGDRDDHQEHHHGDHHDSHLDRYHFARGHLSPTYGQPGHGMGFHGRYDHGMDGGRGTYGYGHGPYGDQGMRDYGRGSHGPLHEHHDEHRRGTGRESHSHGDSSEGDSSEEDTERENNQQENQDNKIWRFQIGDNFGGFEYLDNGHAKGFHIDLMREVCNKAGKTCYFLIDAYHNCWNTLGGRELPGIGLMDHYYDGCIGNLPTPDRLNSLNFTLPFAPNVKCGLLYKPGTQLTSQEAHNVTGKRIGFVDGWALSKRCFQRQEGYTGNSPGQYIPTMFESHKGMMRALIQNEIDAALTVDSFNSDTTKLSLVEPTFSCTTGGSSVMTLYGSEVLDWWNDAFLRMKDDDTFRQLCRRANEEHGHKGRITCLFT